MMNVIIAILEGSENYSFSLGEMSESHQKGEQGFFLENRL